jgi:Ca2+-binding EF-hand superfamily protein
MFRYAFDTFDKNHDGSIDFDEFLLSMAAANTGDVDQRLEQAFDL